MKESLDSIGSIYFKRRGGMYTLYPYIKNEMQLLQVTNINTVQRIWPFQDPIIRA